MHKMVRMRINVDTKLRMAWKILLYKGILCNHQKYFKGYVMAWKIFCISLQMKIAIRKIIQIVWPHFTKQSINYIYLYTCFWTTRRSNQSILKGLNPECSSEGLMLKLKLQYFGHLTGKDSDAGRDWGQEEKGTTEDEMAGGHHRLHGCEFE